MPTDVNFLSGASLPLERNLFFDAVASGKAYLGFARNEPEWGQSALVKVAHWSTNWPADIMAISGDPDHSSNKFYDTNSTKVVTTVSEGDRACYFAWILKTDDVPGASLSDFTFADETEVGQLYLEFVGRQWVRIEGLNPLYGRAEMFDPEEFSKRNFYIFNHSQDLTNRMKIQPIQAADYASLSIKVQLASSQTGSTSNVPSIIHDSAGNLERVINVNGEVVITGLWSEFDITPFSDHNFYILDEDGVVIQDRMKFIEQIEDQDEIFLVFSYPTLKGTAYIKVSNTSGIQNLLSIFHESLPFRSVAAPVADNNPPGLRIGYIKDYAIAGSIFDTTGIQKIDPSEVLFCRQVIDDEDEADLLLNGITAGDIYEFEIEDGLSVKYATSNSLTVAHNNAFDSVMVQKVVANNQPTGDIYRQLYVCYRPKTSSGAEATQINYIGDELFNLNDYETDLGQLFYIANKMPIYRQYINGNETFTLII